MDVQHAIVVKEKSGISRSRTATMNLSLAEDLTF
jgi:hypothetical protein